MELSKDERVHIENPTLWPYSPHCFLQSKFDFHDYGGSATLIGPNIAITAAYNVYNIEKDKEADDVIIFPGANRTFFPLHSKIVDFYYPKKFVTSKGKEENYALLILENELGYKGGYFGLRSLEPEKLKDEVINIIGYPSDKVEGKLFYHEMWGMSGKLLDVNDDFITYDIYTASGQGGAGLVWQEKTDKYYVVGVHAFGGTPNKGTYLNQRRIEQIRLWYKWHLNQNDMEDYYYDIDKCLKPIPK